MWREFDAVCVGSVIVAISVTAWVTICTNVMA